jgi:hypothetical protein
MVVVDPFDRVIAESASGRPAVDDLLSSYVDDAVFDAAAVA